MPRFQKLVRRALTHPGESAPAELADYLERRLFWQQIGVGGDELERWPPERIRHYMLIAQSVAAYEETQAELARRRAESAAKHGR